MTVASPVTEGSPAHTPPDVLVLPLQSDAPWIHAGIAGVTVGCVGAFLPLFIHVHAHWALSLIPALTTAVFTGSALAAWGRRRGGTMTLEVSPGRVDVCEPARRQVLVQRGEPWSAVLLTDRRQPGRRMLVLGQRAETFVVLEPSAASAPDPAVAARWRDRTVSVDLGTLAVSPESAAVVALATGASLDPLLAGMAEDLQDTTALLRHRTTGGEILRVQVLVGDTPEPSVGHGPGYSPGYRTAGEKTVLGRKLWLGEREVDLGADRRVAPYALSTGRTPAVAALGIAQGELAEDMVLLACEDAGVAPGAVVSDVTPDAYVPLHVFEVLRAIVG